MATNPAPAPLASQSAPLTSQSAPLTSQLSPDNERILRLILHTIDPSLRQNDRFEPRPSCATLGPDSRARNWTDQTSVSHLSEHGAPLHRVIDSNNLQSGACCKEDLQHVRPEQGLPERQGSIEDGNFFEQPTQQKLHTSSYLSISPCKSDSHSIMDATNLSYKTRLDQWVDYIFHPSVIQLYNNFINKVQEVRRAAPHIAGDCFPESTEVQSQLDRLLFLKTPLLRARMKGFQHVLAYGVQQNNSGIQHVCQQYIKHLKWNDTCFNEFVTFMTKPKKRFFGETDFTEPLRYSVVFRHLRELMITCLDSLSKPPQHALNASLTALLRRDKKPNLEYLIQEWGHLVKEWWDFITEHRRCLEKIDPSWGSTAERDLVSERIRQCEQIFSQIQQQGETIGLYSLDKIKKYLTELQSRIQTLRTEDHIPNLSLLEYAELGILDTALHALDQVCIRILEAHPEIGECRLHMHKDPAQVAMQLQLLSCPDLGALLQEISWDSMKKEREAGAISNAFISAMDGLDNIMNSIQKHADTSILYPHEIRLGYQLVNSQELISDADCMIQENPYSDLYRSCWMKINEWKRDHQKYDHRFLLYMILDAANFDSHLVSALWLSIQSEPYHQKMQQSMDVKTVMDGIHLWSTVIDRDVVMRGGYPTYQPFINTPKEEVAKWGWMDYARIGRWYYIVENHARTLWDLYRVDIDRPPLITADAITTLDLANHVRNKIIFFQKNTPTEMSADTDMGIQLGISWLHQIDEVCNDWVRTDEMWSKMQTLASQQREKLQSLFLALSYSQSIDVWMDASHNAQVGGLAMRLHLMLQDYATLWNAMTVQSEAKYRLPCSVQHGSTMGKRFYNIEGMDSQNATQPPLCTWDATTMDCSWIDLLQEIQCCPTKSLESWFSKKHPQDLPRQSSHIIYNADSNKPWNYIHREWEAWISKSTRHSEIIDLYQECKQVVGVENLVDYAKFKHLLVRVREALYPRCAAQKVSCQDTKQQRISLALDAEIGILIVWLERVDRLFLDSVSRLSLEIQDLFSNPRKQQQLNEALTKEGLATWNPSKSEEVPGQYAMNSVTLMLLLNQLCSKIQVGDISDKTLKYLFPQSFTMGLSRDHLASWERDWILYDRCYQAINSNKCTRDPIKILCYFNYDVGASIALNTCLQRQQQSAVLPSTFQQARPFVLNEWQFVLNEWKSNHKHYNDPSVHDSIMAHQTTLELLLSEQTPSPPNQSIYSLIIQADTLRTTLTSLKEKTTLEDKETILCGLLISWLTVVDVCILPVVDTLQFNIDIVLDIVQQISKAVPDKQIPVIGWELPCRSDQVHPTPGYVAHSMVSVSKQYQDLYDLLISMNSREKQNVLPILTTTYGQAFVGYMNQLLDVKNTAYQPFIVTSLHTDTATSDDEEWEQLSLDATETSDDEEWEQL